MENQSVEIGKLLMLPLFLRSDYTENSFYFSLYFPCVINQVVLCCEIEMVVNQGGKKAGEKLNKLFSCPCSSFSLLCLFKGQRIYFKNPFMFSLVL